MTECNNLTQIWTIVIVYLSSRRYLDYVLAIRLAHETKANHHEQMNGDDKT